MRPVLLVNRVVVSLLVLGFVAVAQACPQEDQVPARITAPVDEAKLAVLKGNVHRLAQPMFDRGVAPPDLPTQRMLLVLRRSPQQEQALRRLLDEQQDRSSPAYHKWFTPDQFGQQFGPSDQDIQVILQWLRSHNFQVADLTRGRTVIEFSGTAAQVKEAFHTEIHKYVVRGEEHWANSEDPQIPAALASVVAGIATLHNFLKKPQIKIAETRIPAHLQPGPRPLVTFSNGQHALGPGDFYVIYNLTSVIQGPPGISGPAAGFGTTIAVVGRSNINVQDVIRFRDTFNLQENPPQVFVDGPDPGDVGGTDEAEAVLDTSWSGAVAPGARIALIVSASTNTTDGVDLSELYIIDNSFGAIMTESFGSCEATVTAAEATNISQLAEQAAAEGITYIVSAGDTGSAGCDNLSETQATGPLSVNVLASTPFTVAVGGTEFNEDGDDSLYWSSSNNQFSMASALSYIPENVWNESCTVAQCGEQEANIAAGGGGASAYFSKPSWQSGVNGIPHDGMRDVPDVALASDPDHDPYLLCLDGSCQPDAEGNFSFVGIGGTSAAAPSFAGIIALLNSAVVPLNSHPRLGQINYVLYRLAASQNPSTCNGSSTSSLPASSCIFNDVTAGNNAVPGEVGYGTPTANYPSGPGYDLASGLGSVNGANLINNWTTVSSSSTTTTLSLTPTSFVHGAPVNFSVSVTSGNGTPSGDVSLFQSSESAIPIQGNFFTLDSSGSFSGSTTLLPGGDYTVSANYAGDGQFMPSDSNSIFLTVTPEPSSTVAHVLTANQSGSPVGFTTLPYGSFVYVRADVAGKSGVGHATGSVNFTDGGANITGDPYTLNSEGNTATPQGLFTFATGQHSIIASYSGDADFNASTSPAVGFTITPASTATTFGSSSAAQGLSFSATVSTNSFGTPPSGTVTFFIGGTQVGSPVAVTGIAASTNPQTGMLQAAEATATFTDSQLANGQYTISATYSGDTNYAGSSAPPANITLQPDFSLTAGSTSIIIASPGEPGSATLTIGGIDNFSAAVSFSCSGLPSMSNCQFSPSSVHGSGVSTLTITTAAAGAALVMPNGFNRVGWRIFGGEIALAVIFLIGTACCRRYKFKFLRFAVAASVLCTIGCGGGHSAPPPPNPGTVPGTYTVIVTATSGTLTHSVGITLNVQ